VWFAILREINCFYPKANHLGAKLEKHTVLAIGGGGKVRMVQAQIGSRAALEV